MKLSLPWGQAATYGPSVALYHLVFCMKTDDFTLIIRSFLTTFQNGQVFQRISSPKMDTSQKAGSLLSCSLVAKSTVAAQRAVTACIKFSAHWLHTMLSAHSQCKRTTLITCIWFRGANRKLVHLLQSGFVFFVTKPLLSFWNPFNMREKLPPSTLHPTYRNCKVDTAKCSRRTFLPLPEGITPILWETRGLTLPAPGSFRNDSNVLVRKSSAFA